MKKLAFLTGLLTILLFAGITSATLCYQEDPQVATSCGGLSGGSFTVNTPFQYSGWFLVNDSNWSTWGYTYSSGVYTTAIWVKPAGATAVNWTGKCGTWVWANGSFCASPTCENWTYNVSIPAVCLNASSGNVTVRWLADTYPLNTSVLSCIAYDTNEVTVQTFGNSSADCSDTAEVAMWWDIAPALPNATFVSQVPDDIDTLNAFGNPINITYNITSSIGINASTAALYFKTNTSSLDCWIYINGVQQICGWLTGSLISNVSDNWTFALYSNQIYPAIYNINETYMEQTPHSVYTFTGHSSYVKIRLFNVSSIKRYSIFEVMANDSSALTTLGIFYCNDSYSTGDPDLSANCVKFYDLLGNVPYNHTHSIYSSHMLIPFAIDNVTGLVNGLVMATPTSYFLLRGNTSAWNAYYIANDTNSAQTTIDNGTTWLNMTGTIDAHLHQYDGTDSLWYYAYACDTSENCVNSSLRQDLLQTGGLPPTVPDLLFPLAGIYLVGAVIPIQYTPAVSPNAYDIASYNISLLNPDHSLIKTLIANNSPSLSYTWQMEKGDFIISITACDTIGQCSTGYSLPITGTGILIFALGGMGLLIALGIGAGILLFIVGTLIWQPEIYTDPKNFAMTLITLIIGAAILLTIM
jgi:hypothetical protein